MTDFFEYDMFDNSREFFLNFQPCTEEDIKVFILEKKINHLKQNGNIMEWIESEHTEEIQDAEDIHGNLADVKITTFPLCKAVIENCPKIVELFLENGADPNRSLVHKTQYTKVSYNLLSIVKDEIFDLLLKYGENPNPYIKQNFHNNSINSDCKIEKIVQFSREKINEEFYCAMFGWAVKNHSVIVLNYLKGLYFPEEKDYEKLLETENGSLGFMLYPKHLVKNH